MRYVSVDEYLMGRAQLVDLPDEYVQNINKLIPKVNDLLEKFGSYRKVTSGFRTAADQARINPKATKSNHLTGSAVDLEDADGKLKVWILNNLKVLEDLGLYCEAFSATPTWVHIQHVRPKSGNRLFNP